MDLSPSMLLKMGTARVLSEVLNSTEALNATRCGLPQLVQVPEIQSVVVVESCMSYDSLFGSTDRCFYDRNRTLAGGEVAVVGSGESELLMQQHGNGVCFAWGKTSYTSGGYSNSRKEFECKNRCLSLMEWTPLVAALKTRTGSPTRDSTLTPEPNSGKSPKCSYSLRLRVLEV
ncbi:unnamed protein product [Durusdinium trenchii]|uniref:Uncharacterized protein n=1 Tax=Durusdinium trenchii TaxID=1381693 RepID=A0ABP0M6N0_9DINO